MEVGLRVMRGPNWKWQNQDDGEGHLGTVVEIGKPGNSNTPDKTVVVQWDSGFRTNYRVGYQGSYDLKIYDNAPTGVKHQNIICDACKKQGVQGMRWKCSKCHDFDLCHVCYMGDKHDMHHAFIRYDSASFTGVKVPKRSASVKIQSRGILNGAKVVRGPDWDWGNQDGGQGKTGKVLDIRGWDNESGRSVANVAWSTGSTNVYRIGHKGKVDLKYIEDGSGGTFYNEHLPTLGEHIEASPSTVVHSLYKVGDKVRVDLDVLILKAMQEGHGGWNPRMAEFVGQTGFVHRITERGDVRVQYEGCSNRWTFHSGALTKIFHFAVGDQVQIVDDPARVRDLQKGHGEWTDNMKAALGRRGKVLKVYADGDLRVSVGGQIWTFNPSCCVQERSAHQDENNTLDRRREHREDTHNTTMNAILEQLLEVKALASPGVEPGTVEPERLVREAAQGHLEVVRDIIAKHPDRVDEKSSGKSALQVACHQGHLEVIQLLLGASAGLEVQDEDGDTALHYSAFGNQPEVSELLLQKGATLDALNLGGCSALHVAVNKQHVQCVEVLLRHNCDVNIQDSYGDTALHDAIGKDSVAIEELLIAHQEISLTLKNKRGFNVLHHAALKGNNHASELILQKARQTVDLQKDDGFAALHLSALNGHVDVANTLITVGKADLEIRNNRRQTPLLLAVSPWSHGHPAIVELLISKGACIDVEDEDRNSCLHLALMRQASTLDLETAPAIEKIQQDLTSQFEDGCPATVAMGCYLIGQGADLSHKNHQNRTPLDLTQDSRVADALQRAARNYIQQNQKVVAHSVGTEECMVCSDLMADVTFDPCGHCVVCSECCLRMKRCFVCQTAIEVKYGPDGSVLGVAPESEERKQLREYQRRFQQMEDTLNCSICMENVRSVAFMCGHSACMACAQPLKVCHMCRKPIQRKINLFS